MTLKNLDKELRKSLREAAREVYNNTPQITDEEAFEKILAHEYIAALDAQVVLEAAVVAARDNELKERTKHVPVDSDAPNTVLRLFPMDEWGEHGVHHEGMFVKNRHATRAHNKRRMQNVEANYERVRMARDENAERFALLEIAYDSDPSVETNEQAIAWLTENYDLELDLK